MKIIKKILIANRGEIAVRIIQTARKMGIVSVAVFSASDIDSLAVRMADEKYSLGAGTLKDTYLNISKLIETAKKSGADAIHPGYGFLSENELFAKACEENGIIFIGPSSPIIAQMGNKIEARKIAKELEIPITDSIEGSVAELLKTEIKIPYPLLIKAAAGGGGKGMKIVRQPSELREALESANREALNYFGDGTVYIEKYIEDPRHIEVQVLGDKYGNCIHLFERECTIQRRHQKIIEEAPSAILDEKTREKMHDAAIRIAKYIGYNNAGTIEFLADKNLDFYFLEMNTRIQVEHPVTELVTEVDMVEEQILIAQGLPLRYEQEDVQCLGHAVECRIYAENPENNFLPSPGKMTYYHEPEGVNIRVDSSVDKAELIHSDFDPMISKLACWGEDREHALLMLKRALEEYAIHGIDTNIPYLHETLIHPEFADNRISTSFCGLNTDAINNSVKLSRESYRQEIVVAAILLYDLNIHLDTNIWEKVGFWRSIASFGVFIGETSLQVGIDFSEGKIIVFSISGKQFEAMLIQKNGGQIEFLLDGGYFKAFLSMNEAGKTMVTIGGITFTTERQDTLNSELKFDLQGHGLHENEITSPMFGKLLKLNVADGQEIKAGTIMMIVEAMKMENNIVAKRDCMVEKVHAKEGQMLESNALLITLAELKTE